MLDLPEDTVHIWWVDFGDADDGWLALLSEVERNRFEAYRRPDDRARFLTGTMLVRRLFAEELQIEAASVRLDRSCPDCDKPHGKTRLAPSQGDPAQRIEVSISHSGRWVGVAACRTHPVGVDVELVNHDVDHVALGRFAMTPAELERFVALSAPDRPAAFTRSWVRKEAVVKAIGEGLRTPLSDFQLSAPPDPPAVVAWPARPDLTDRLQLHDLSVDTEHMAAVAILDGPPMRVVSLAAANMLS